MNAIKNFWNDEEGLETVEMLLILSVLIVVAFLFKDKLKSWVEQLFDKVEGELEL